MFPISTDAPIYHFPWATIGLIAANLVCFGVTGFGMVPDKVEPWILEYGNGINPREWLTSSFAHGDWMHLIGNMLFLWCFGLVVEGKLGWRRFLPLYLLILICSGATTDLLTESLSNEEGGCLGSSDVIFGLMLMSVVWAPKNELQWIFLIGMTPYSKDISILTTGLFYTGLNLLDAFLNPGMGSSALHLIGGVFGLIAGVVYLKRGWVDCENWDVFAVLSGSYGRFSEKNRAGGTHGGTQQAFAEIPTPRGVDSNEAESSRGNSRRKLLKNINDLIDARDFLTAADELLALRMQHTDLYPNEERTKKLAIGLMQADAWDQAEIWLQEYIQRYPEDNRWARIRLAQLMLNLQRPRAALKQLNGLRTEGLPDPLVSGARQVLRKSKALVEEGVPDAEPEY